MTIEAGMIGAGGVAGLGLVGMHDPDSIGTERVAASHAGGYAAVDDVELVAVADVDDETRRTFADVWEMPDGAMYASHEEMLADRDLDIVSVCTPTFLHADHVIDAARSAADPDVIWCEKPLASSLTAGERMVEVCAETGTELVVNHTSRFTPSMQQLHQLVAEEDLLGEVRSIGAQFRMELVRNSTHLIDTVIHLTDLDPVEVAGHLTHERELDETLDTTGGDDTGGGGFLVLENGAFATIDCTLPRDLSTMAYQFFGTNGRLTMDIPIGEWRYWELTDDGHVERELPIDLAADDYAQGFANGAAHLVDLVHGEATNVSSGGEALRSLEAIVGLYLSDVTGSKLSLPLDRPLRDVTIQSW